MNPEAYLYLVIIAILILIAVIGITRSNKKNKQLEKEIRKLKKDVNFYSDITAHSANLNVKDEECDIPVSKLDEEQKSTYDLMMNTDQNLFITGKAGTGKSTLLKVFCQNAKKTVLKLSPTGIAARNIHGATLHSAFGYDNLVTLDHKEIRDWNIKLSNSKRMTLKRVQAIIIDEISMVRADTLQKIDVILKVVNGNTQPFGGKQMILFGDVFQLPPIAYKEERLYLDKEFGGIHFFASSAYKKGNFKFVELTTNHRQSEDPHFFDILNDIRIGEVSDTQLALLNERKQDFDSSDLRTATRLFPTKNEVEFHNQAALDDGLGTERAFEAQVVYPPDGKLPDKDKFEAKFPVSLFLRIKKGSLVMFVNNNGDKWKNGSIGIVSEIYRDRIIVSVEKEVHEVFPAKFEQLEAKYDERLKKIVYKKVFEVSQYPIVLAYAMTIHKAQGQTYGQIAVDVSRSWDPGQAYVALSRVRKLSGLYLLNYVTRDAIKTDINVLNFYNSNKAAEESAE